MKRMKFFSLALAVLFAAVLALPSAAASAISKQGNAHEQPKLYLTHVPAYGETTDVTGKAALESGKALNTADYRVTLFLQTEAGGKYWVKPTYERPSVKLDQSGAFCLDYTTGGIDEKAVTLHILLIPADYIPSEFNKTRGHALDYVRVDRSRDGKNTVTPSSATAPAPTPDPMNAYRDEKDKAVFALSDALAKTRESLYVYRDFGDTWNNFTQKAKMAGKNAGLVKDMDENWRENAYSGRSCIRCQIDTEGTDWGGWMFLNGYLPAGETVPRLNDGTRENAGLDLTGARELRFFARGEKGGEKVEFFTAGFGYHGETGKKTVKYPDSAKKQSLDFVTLTSDWQEYVIPLSDADMSDIACGFGYVLSGDKSGSADNVFYLDDIRFTGKTAYLQNASVLLRSYDTDNVYIQNAAFSYDNALVAMAFLSENKLTEAAQILDAFVYAVEHDRQTPGRVRNAYAAGVISALPGWKSGARLPGWYDMSQGETGTWYEDRYQVGSNVGNTSYVALALLQYDAVSGNQAYLNTAKALMDWVIENCSDGGDGFTAGFDGWAEGEPPVVYPFPYKSIEHNIDAYAAFTQLYARTGDTKYTTAADSALSFIQSMYDADAGVFYTGTLEDGVTPNKRNIVLDAQVWAALALGEDFTPYDKSLERVSAMRTAAGGYPFCESNANGGWWAEGTAYTALMYRLRGEDAAAVSALDALCAIQLASGAFPAATVEALSTGFELFDSSPWVYSDDPHIAPSAWFVMAVNGFNPYTF